jgi:cytochrome P450
MPSTASLRGVGRVVDDDPEQKAALPADFDGRIDGAVGEFVRWPAPRSRSAGTELRGQRIGAGEKIVLFHPSGNRDETVSADAHRFDISAAPTCRSASPGGGPHFWPGGHLPGSGCARCSTSCGTGCRP